MRPPKACHKLVEIPGVSSWHQDLYCFGRSNVPAVAREPNLPDAPHAVYPNWFAAETAAPPVWFCGDG